MLVGFPRQLADITLPLVDRVSNCHQMGRTGTSFHTGAFAAEATDSLVLESSLNIVKHVFCICQTLSYEAFRKLKDIKENVIG